MTATPDDRDRATRDRLAEVLREHPDLTVLWPGSDRIADALLPVVAELVREGQAEAVREFYIAAADEATTFPRRGPNAVADWLLDFGHAYNRLRASRTEGAET